LKRASARAGSDAYQGAFEAVGAVLVACGIGFFVDGRWDTGPWGVVVGVVIGFAAMVLRLVRLGHELHPEWQEDGKQQNESAATLDADEDDGSGAGSGAGLTPGMSDVLEEDASTPQRKKTKQNESKEDAERRE
jgi:F0F1-type ATP synthase assembly protein I